MSLRRPGPTYGRAVAWLVAIALGGAPTSAWGAPALTVSSTTEYRGDNANQIEGDDDYGVSVNRITLTESVEGLAANLRIDGATFLDRPSHRYKNDLRLERIRVEYRIGELVLQGGDQLQQLGRGIILSLRKQDELGFDVTVRGGRVDYEGEVFTGLVFAGHANPTNIDTVSQRYVRDPRDFIGGGSGAWQLGGGTVSVFGAYVQPRERLLEARDETFAGGASLDAELVPELLHLYVEADARRELLAGVASNGYAGYATADVTLSRVSLLFEGLYLDEFEMRGSQNAALASRFTYNRPPTLQRIEEEVIGNRDVLGGRVRAEVRPGEGDLLVSANAVMRYDAFDEPAQVLQLHGWGGAEYLYDGGQLRGTTGYREERQGELRILRMLHADGYWLTPAAGAFSAELSGNVELRRNLDRTYVRGSSSLGVTHAELGGLAAEIGYDTQNPSADVRQLFVAGTLTWHVNEVVHLIATGGTQRGGIKCISGMCRRLPSFSGGRLELELRL